MGSEALGTVRDWMSGAPVAVPPTLPVEQVIHRMRARGIRHVLVVDGDQLVGIASNRDVRWLPTERAVVTPFTPVSHVMTEAPVTVSPDVGLIEAARVMLEHKIGALPVLEGDRLVGILTRSDALEALVVWAEGQISRRER